ncbi:MAG: hypothetical protein EB084_03490 [Proteobacteria bacterium]|nr:hypothetical protein [Pseudomonadota bacterium]
MSRRLTATVLLLVLTSLSLMILVITRRPPSPGVSRPSPTPLPESRAGVMTPAPPVTAKSLHWATSRDLRTWREQPQAVPGQATPQLARLDGRLVTLSSDTVRLFIMEQTPTQRDSTAMGPPQALDIEGERDRFQVDPDLVSLPGGGCRLYYTSTRSGSDPAFDVTEIHSATRREGRWVRDAGYRFRGVGVVDPDVIHLADGRWRLFFTRGPERFIGSAVSVDGLDFEVEPTTRIDGQVSATIATREGFLMAYQTYGGRYNQGLLHMARSRDGLHFTSDPDFRWEEKMEQLEGPSVIALPDGTYLMAYARAQRSF